MNTSRLFTTSFLDTFAAQPEKLNMCAASARSDLLLVAIGKDIHVFKIDYYLLPPTLRTRFLYPDRSLSDEINAISLGTLFGQEVVIAVYETGKVIIWKVDLTGTILYTYQNDSSTWGCAIHGATNTIAISANSFNITILEPSSPPTDAPAQLRRRFVLKDHDGNIPNVKFSACGNYLASASIDLSIRVWDLRSGTPICSYFDRRWCWSAMFVYPFYFVPESVDAASTLDSTQAGALGDLSTQLVHFIRMMNETIDANDHNDDNEEEGEATSEDVDWEVVDEADNGDEDGIGDNNAPPGRYHPHILDHSDDIQNGHTPTTGSDIRDNGSESHSDDQSFYDAEDGAEPEPTVHDGSQSQEPENAAQTRAAGQSMDQSSDGLLHADSIIATEPTSIERSSPLILCSTKYDLLLVDPSREYMPVLDKIPFVALATSGEWLESLNFFDRIAFLDWIPELGAAVAASYSGNVTIVGLMQKTSTDPGSSKHSFGLRVIARIPQSAQITHKLYGVAIYRRSVDILSQSCSVIIYVVYMDGTMHGYELRPPLFDNVTA